jgi:hypothetical protein
MYQETETVQTRRRQIDVAIQLAMESRWEEAVQTNRAIIGVFPNDTDSYNRLGKALMELGKYNDAKKAYKKAIELDSTNQIAKKNLDRLGVLAKTGAPQWIVVGWRSNLNQPSNKRLHDAIVNNFDFEFLYNSFFAPEKVTGRSYAPLRNPAAVEPAVTTAASASSKARAADPNVYFFDDFSTTPAGKPPIGWKSTLNSLGASSVVAKIDGMPGHWATTTGFTLTPGQLKMPLPADFTLTYDLVASANYAWGTRGMTFTLSYGAVNAARGSFVSLTLRPGSGSRDGDAELEAQFPKAQGYLSGSKWFKVPGFFDKAQSTVAVTIVKQGERLEVFLNKAKVFESDKAVPAGLVFDQLSLNQGGTFDANSRMFISNLTILKK